MLLIVGCKTDYDYVKLEAFDPRYFEVYGVAPAVDEMHAVPIKGPQGRVWYREAKPVLDLTAIDMEFTYAETTPFNDQGEYRVIVGIKDPFQQRLAAWCRERQGMYGGVAIDGKLVEVDHILGELYVTMAIRFPSLREAQAAAQAIRAGGEFPGNKGAKQRGHH